MGIGVLMNKLPMRSGPEDSGEECMRPGRVRDRANRVSFGSDRLSLNYARD